MERCPACAARHPVAVAAPRHGSMLSDGARCGVTVHRRHCRNCGLGWLPERESGRLPRRTFGNAYALGACAPSAADLARAGGYAARILALWGPRAPASLLDVGCGNGALMTELARRWPGTRVQGIEPAPRVAGAARAAGHRVARALRPGVCASLVVCVNVIEHTPDPVAFLRSLRRAVAPGGAAVVICPDGSIPWLELLMADHRWSLTAAAVTMFASRAGFSVTRMEASPGGFQAVLLRPALRASARRRADFIPVSARRCYLAAWAALDRVLLARADPQRRLICFGVGEVARLLRANAPGSWSRVAGLTADDAAGAEELGLPFLPPDQVDIARDQILLALRPGLQPQLAGRFGDGPTVLRWDDLVHR